MQADRSAIRPGGRGRVLVIEHDAPTRAVLRSSLEFDGFDVVTAAKVAGRLAVMSKNSLDAILLALDPTGADDVAFLACLRAVGALGQQPVVVAIAEDSEQHRQRGRTLGADSYVSKPVDPGMLASHLDELMSRSRSA